MIDSLLKDKLKSIANDDYLLAAFKALFAERIKKEKPIISEIADNALLGEKFRAYETAKDILDKTFNDLAAFKSGFQSPANFDKSR